MSKFILSDESYVCPILVEDSAFEGVKRIASVVAGDIELVCGRKPAVISALDAAGSKVVFAATVGKSLLLDKLVADDKLDISGIEGKREVFTIATVTDPFDGVSEALVVVGSDKRGTIYGLFTVSETCGVSPLVFWGDAVPVHKNEILLDYTTPFVSKEPSVKYRGFFINDEWPAFGNWTVKHFGGVNAKAYEPVFQLLLRLKGNYFWPAMWSACFSEDGPGIANAELANTYGVIMGASHHEPMCRAGVEWQRVYRQYGNDNTWSFISNREAITKFWREGLERNKSFENIITVGMRGENDSLLLGANATLEDNINVLREVIRTQNALMREIVNPDLDEIPRMLALYNEVEDFYYAENGLKNWKELDNVILMLCDDNFANLRYLPTDDDRHHKGGFGMYFHYDYHGASISYEWANTNRLTKTWEQMTMAYDYGVRDLWIVNLGDIKGLEYPLCYFMDLAYDFERYGSSAINSTETYVKSWIRKQYGGWLTDAQLEDVYTVINGYTKYNNLRTPESMNSRIYAPVNFREGDRVHKECSELIELVTKLYNEAPEEIKPSIYTVLYYPTVASLNLVQMHIEAGMNNHYASYGSLAANRYLDCVKTRAKKDDDLRAKYDSVLGGKWHHMMDSAHTGFNCWCDEDWSYPTISEVYPVPKAKSYVSFAGYDQQNIGRFWSKSAPLTNREFMRPDTEFITINIETGSSADMTYRILCDKDWLTFERTEGSLTACEGITSVNVTCDRSKLTAEETASVIVECRFGTQVTKARLFVAACDGKYDYAPGTFVDTEGYIAMDADRFTAKHDVDNCAWTAIDHLSRLDRPAIKVLPSTAQLINDDDSFKQEDLPYVEYTFIASKGGEWDLDLWLSCRNQVSIDAKLRTAFSVNDSDITVLSTVADSYKARKCAAWNKEILDVMRSCKTSVTLNEGINTLRIYGGDANIILQKIIMTPKGKPLGKTYLGPRESYYTK